MLPIEIHALQPSPDCRKHWLTRSHVKVYLVRCLNTYAMLCMAFDMQCFFTEWGRDIHVGLKKAFINIMSENNGPVVELK